MTRLKLFIPLIVFLVLAALLWRGLSLDPNYMPSALESKPLPTFSMQTLAGEQVSDADLRGDYAIVNVWATWCPSCHVEHAYLNLLAKQGVIIFGINYKDDPQAARDWLTQRGDPYRFNIVDQEGQLGLDMGVTGAPETYLLSPDGTVLLRHQGPLDARVWAREFEPLIQRAEAG